MINNSTSVCKFNFLWSFSSNIENEFMSIWGGILIYISHLCFVCMCVRESESKKFYPDPIGDKSNRASERT